ncbi:MAG: hypothetical protein IT318_13205 [Anaerolineales bacterium]|nr:hypothetical protein [Anaerolineales bacterium]
MTAPLPVDMQVTPEGAAAWGLPLQAAGCSECDRVYLVPATRLGIRCPACSGASLAPRPARLPAEPPELLVPFHQQAAALGTALDEWARRIWLRPKELAGAVLQGRLVPGYVPMWLVDADAAGSWQAQVGYHYDVASANEHYQNGQWVTQHVIETRTRWEPRAGQVRRAYHNVAVPALEDHARLTAQVGEWALDTARPYTAQTLAEAVVRMPSLEPGAAWPFARSRLDQRVAADCQSAAGGQHIEQAQLAIEYRQLHWTQLLLPLYSTAYQDDDGQWIPVVINGQTGRISGVRRASQKAGWQWTGAIAAVAMVLLVVAAALAVAGALFPPLVGIGGALLILILLIGLIAPIPALWAWQHNRRGAA